MDELGGHDADGGHVLELSLHDVEMLVESPGLVRHGQEEDPEKEIIVFTKDHELWNTSS